MPTGAKDILKNTAKPSSDVTAQDRYDAANDFVSLRMKFEKTVKFHNDSATGECKRTVTAGVKKVPARMFVGISTNDIDEPFGYDCSINCEKHSGKLVPAALTNDTHTV